MIWFCRECLKLVIPHDDDKCVKAHGDKIVGMREDVFQDSMRAIVRELRITERLVPFKK